jgi:tRNA modification GTPase
MTPTIYALSSGRAAAGVAVIRVSGPQAHDVARALAGTLPPLRRASLRTLRDGAGQPLDSAMLLLFARPRSATGEDVAEFHVHGGPAVIEAVLGAIAALPGIAPAQPGDFTRRAFDNGKLDLTQVEGLADLIEAESEAQRVQALRQMEGGLSRLCEGWRLQLLKALALVEADIDFAEGEDDVPDGIAASAQSIIRPLLADIAAHLDDGQRGERLRDGLTVTIVGPPNAGKSSLLNALARADHAIVSPLAGTTRDSIAVPLRLGGYPVTLIDTAGLRDSDDVIEAEGVRRARARAAAADLVLSLSAPGLEAVPMTAAQLLHVVSKIDLSGAPAGDHDGSFHVSAVTGAGLDALKEALVCAAAAAMDSSGSPALTRARHRHALSACANHLEAALSDQRDLVLVAEELRLAARALARISGRIDVDDVLGEIFSSFCVGK